MVPRRDTCRDAEWEQLVGRCKNLGEGSGLWRELGKAKVIPRACLEEVMPTQSGQVQAPLSTFITGDV